MKPHKTLISRFRNGITTILTVIAVVSASHAIADTDFFSFTFFGMLPFLTAVYVIARLNCDYFGEQWGTDNE